MSVWIGLSVALAGTVLASVLACVPGLHVYSVAGLIALCVAGPVAGVPEQGIAMLFLGMVVGYAVCNTIPSLFAGVPDESVLWMMLPLQRYVDRGRGQEAAALSGIGSLGAVLVLVLLTLFFAPTISAVRQITMPHLHWLLGLSALYLLLSEWPRGMGRGDTALARLWDGWRSLSAGLAAFALSGVLGVVIASRPIVPLDVSSQGLMPAFVGLFGIPWVLQNIASRAPMPKQQACVAVDVNLGSIVLGVGAGSAGGLLAALFPAITGSLGGMLAGHAIARRDDRIFVISQGACKAFYYVGALLLFFVPGLRLTRGGMAWMLRPRYVPISLEEYWLAAAATVLCGTVAFLLLLWLSRLAAAFVGWVHYRWGSVLTLGVLVWIVLGTTGWNGLLIAAAGTGIGLIPVVFHSRRVNCMGVLLVPTLVRMAGAGPFVARCLGLV